MELTDFLKNFAGEFEMTDASDICPETVYGDLDEWDSLLGLAIIAMIRREYNVKVTGEEIKDSVTVKALFDLVNSRK